LQLQLEAETERMTRELKETNSQGAIQHLHLQAEVQRMTTALAQANSQLAMHQLQTRQLEEEMHKLKPQLPATEAAARGQHADRDSPSDAASSMQQPQTLRERELLRAEAAEGQLAELQKQNAALKEELEKVKDAPQVEDDDISMKKAENKQLFTVIYYLGSIDSMI
jgi:hypothetical protein